MSTTAAVTLGPADLKEGEVRGYAVGRQHVLVVRHQGRLCAMDDACNHGGCLLSGGRVESGQIVCPCHEVGFDLVTGRNVTSPGVCDDQPLADVADEGGTLIWRGRRAG